MTDIPTLVANLQADEGWRGFLYDDATGYLIKPGSTVKGHPTIGWGFAMDVAPFTQAELLPILTSRAKAADSELHLAASWVPAMTEPRQRALSNMAYQLGVTGLLKFNTFMSMMQQARYEEAADDLATTAWYSQSGDRAKRIQELIRNG